MDMQILIEQFCDYSVSIRGYSKATIRRYRYVLHCYCRFTGVVKLSDATEEKTRQLFFHGRTQRQWSVNTFLVYRNTLVVFFSWCIKQRYIESNPIADIEVPKATKRIPFKLSQQNAFKLLEVVQNYPYDYRFLRYRNHAIFATFIFTGIRKQELLNLKYSDVDLENLTLFVHQGKGNKDRIVPISYSLAQILKKYIIERKRLNRTCPEFFVSLNRNHGYTNDGLKRLVSQMNEASGIKFTVHKLRHTFATLMLEGGCDIFSLSTMMGHSDIKTTTIYLSATTEHLRKQITKHPLNSF
jgi:site-specific recombinase XerD